MNVPPEILQIILSHHRDDRRTLKACTLVNRVWRHASRIYLFRSVDLSVCLRRDWLSLLLTLPFGIGDSVREAVFRNLSWPTTSSAGHIRVLSHFATSLTTLHFYNLVLPDFSNIAFVLSTFHHLCSLSVNNVRWESNTLDFSQPIPPNKTFPPFLSSARLYYCDAGTIVAWFLAHPSLPSLKTFYLGPVKGAWTEVLHPFYHRALSTIEELGFIVPQLETDAKIYYSYSGSALDAMVEWERPYCAQLKIIADRFLARHGFPIQPSKVPFENLAIVRIHQFLFGKRKGMGIWVARMMVSLKGQFRGQVVLDVDVATVWEIDGLDVDWDLLDDIFSTDTFEDMVAIVFLALTNVNLLGLANFISVRMPKAFARGLLVFRKAEERPF